MYYIGQTIPGASSTTIETFDPAFGKKVVRLILTKQAPASMAHAVRIGLKNMKMVNLEYDFVDKGPQSEGGCISSSTTSLFKGPSAGRPKLLDELDVVKWALRKTNCRYRQGKVYKFENGSTMTYSEK